MYCFAFIFQFSERNFYYKLKYNCVMMRLTLAAKVVTFFVGLSVLIVGFFMVPVLDEVLHHVISAQLPIRDPESNFSTASSQEAFSMWKDVPVPMYLKFRLFHLENPLEVLQFGEKPLLTEKGPYVYSETRHKQNISFSPDGKVVTYREIRIFNFIPELSKGSEEDVVRLINMPFLTVLVQTKGLNWFIRKTLQGFFSLTSSQLFEEKTVNEWIWGYEDPLLKLVKDLKPDLVPFTTFGWFMNKNNSDDGQYEIMTGLGNVSHENQVVSWNGKQNLDVWRSSYCNMINGTDGSMFHPFVSKKDSFFLYSTDICRSISIVFEKESSVSGIPTYRFVVPESAFASPTDNPDNLCYCTPDDSHCLSTGVLNVSACQFGAPAISSLPHFYMGDATYLDAVRGLNPNENDHETFLNIEPLTGAVLSAAKRLQVNAFVQNLGVWSSYFNNFPGDMILPVFWIEETAAVDEPLASKFKSRVSMNLLLMSLAKIGVISLGALMMAAVILIQIVAVLRKKATPALLEKSTLQGKENIINDSKDLN